MYNIGEVSKKFKTTNKGDLEVVSLRKILISLFLVFSLCLNCIPVFAMSNNSGQVEQIKKLVTLAENEKQQYGDATEETIKKLENKLNEIGIETGSYGGTHVITAASTISTQGYGETHELKRGWSYRVDRPAVGDAKPHVHVENEKLGIKSMENVDGTESHGTTLDNDGVPKDIQKEVKGSKDFKKGQNDLKKMKKAKSDIESKNLDLYDANDLIIAMAIFVAAVGVAFFAPEVFAVALFAI